VQTGEFPRCLDCQRGFTAFFSDVLNPMSEWYGSTIVLLNANYRIASRMTAKIGCEELDLLKRAAASAILEAKRIRLSRDVSIYEDAELCREGHRRIYVLLKHLLVGHDGSACPAGDRPVVTATKPELREAALSTSALLR
jgi:hypothetical protein